MFQSHTAHSHLLAPRDYSAPEVYAAEQRQVFRRAWNVVASVDQLAKPGQQLAIDIGGIPVLVRNDAGTLRAYRNVCAHRHSLVAPAGFTCQSKLRCQYHGWEYGSDGALSHLPDGSSFKGWKATNARLEQLRCEAAFGLVFVNPTAGSGSLRAEFGSVSPALDQHFVDLSLRWIQITEHDVNWKIIVENAVEGYHVPMVHQQTFVTYQDERFHDHVIEPMFTQYHDLKSAEPARPRDVAIDRLLFRSKRLWGYSHTHIFPNHLLSWAGFYREWVIVEPLGPRRSRRIGYGFMPNDLRASGALAPLWRVAVGEIARRTRKMADKILGEDSSLWDSVQRGTEASPHAGVLSAREERVAAFQQWLVAQRDSPGATSAAPITG
ncbi:MAG: cbdA 2 [Myxococcales bacterium]|nr:cbdA 2 [Myxococcales bacterium]